jgi:hypothetical protein
MVLSSPSIGGLTRYHTERAAKNSGQQASDPLGIGVGGIAATHAVVLYGYFKVNCDLTLEVANVLYA